MEFKKAILLIAVSGCSASTNVETSAPATEVPVVAPAQPEFERLEPVSFESVSTPVPEEEKETVIGLCEPMDERWKYPTDEQRAETRALIKKTCRAMGVGSEDCKFFYGVISGRESSHRPWVRHKLPGDQAAALVSYMRNSHEYGWSVRWSDDGDLEYMEYGESQNEYFTDASRWSYGLGLGGLNVSYHLSKFDNLAPPEILCDTVINTMVQITIARYAVRRYGASNFAQVQAIYAGRTIQDEDGRLVPLSCVGGCPKTASAEDKKRARNGDANVLKRCDTYGLDCRAKPSLGSRINLDSMSVEDRYAAAAAIRGAELPGFE